ncbi:MAG: hypothetical protein Q9174_003347, partial [Haloplaca sp. 1 TL-2023]
MDLKEFDDALVSSSTKLRQEELYRLNDQLRECSIPQLLTRDIVTTLFRTYPFYHDRPSRKAVRECLGSLIANGNYPDALPLVIAGYKEEASKTSLAAPNAFVLVEFGALLLTRCGAEKRTWDMHGMEIATLYAQILDTCMAGEGRPSLKHSALVVTRRALRTLFKGDDAQQRVRQIIDHLISPSSLLGPRAGVFLGVVAGVCVRRPHLKTVLEVQRASYITFFLREILGSRSHIPHHIAHALADFFFGYITVDDLKNDIVPATEKALLRAPEVVLNDLISPMISSLPEEIDVAQLLAEKLARPLLSNFKSSNATIREGAVSTFKTLIKHSRDATNLSKVADEVLTPLSASKLTAAEHRILHCQILAELRNLPQRSEVICKALATVASKETNEAALATELRALSYHLALMLTTPSKSDEKSSKVYSDAACKGLSDKKPAIRRAWVLMVGELLWQTRSLDETTQVRSFGESVVPKLLEIYQDVTTNLISSTQSGLAVTSFVLTALCTYLMSVIENGNVHASIRKASIYEQACQPNSKGLFLFSHRICSRLTTEEDVSWALRALGACATQLPTSEDAITNGINWAQAIIYFIAAASVPHDLRREARTTLAEYYRKDPSRISRCIIRGLWSWQQDVLTGKADSAAAVSKTGNTRLHLAVQAICPTRAKEQANGIMEDSKLQNQLTEMLVLCRPPLIPNAGWIEICLAAGQDPGHIARSHSDQCLVQVESCMGTNINDSYNAEVRTATYNAVAELAFVAPDTFIPILVQMVEDKLSADELRNCTPTDIAIARTPEGTAFVDVLSAKGQERSLDKSAKDYDTLKWEAEVRSQLAAKKGQERKLTADERAKVEVQLKKEAVIRQRLLALEQRLRQGVGIIRALTDGPPTDASLWFAPISRALLTAIAANAGLLLGSDAEMAYINLAKLMSPRLGSLRSFVGVASLRGLGTSTLPETMKEESLGDLVTRILYRIRFMSEQRPFDTISLLYMLPLAMKVLQAEGVGRADADEIDEQITLALEFFTFHANL